MYLLRLWLRLWLLTIWSCSPWHTTTAHRIAAPIPRYPPPSYLHQECCAKLPPLWFMCKLNSVCLGSEHPAWFSSALSSQVSVRLVSLFSPLSVHLALPLSPLSTGSGLVSKLNLLELCPVCRLFADTKHSRHVCTCFWFYFTSTILKWSWYTDSASNSDSNSNLNSHWM